MGTLGIRGDNESIGKVKMIFRSLRSSKYIGSMCSDFSIWSGYIANLNIEVGCLSD